MLCGFPPSFHTKLEFLSGHDFALEISPLVPANMLSSNPRIKQPVAQQHLPAPVPAL